jgi:hypothetical protein
MPMAGPGCRRSSHRSEARPPVFAAWLAIRSRAPKSRAGCAISLRPSACGRCLRVSRRQSPIGPTISTHSQGASWAVASIISARKVRSSCRSRPNPTCTSRKPTGSGRSSSRARHGAGRSRRERTQAPCVSSCGATIFPVLDGNRKYSTQGQNNANDPNRKSSNGRVLS